MCHTYVHECRQPSFHRSSAYPPTYAFKANIMCIMLPAISHNARQSYRKGASIKFCRFLSYTFYFFLFLTSTLRLKMARARCQRCYRRPGRRIWCGVCNYAVGPGCCLATEFPPICSICNNQEPEPERHPEPEQQPEPAPEPEQQTE